MKNKKGFIRILLVVSAIIVMALLVYVRMGYRTKIIPSSITGNKTSSGLQSNEKNIIDDWKIYRNEKYGFEVRYPKDWVEKDEIGYDYSFRYSFVNLKNNYKFVDNISEDSTGGTLGNKKDYISIIEADNIVRTKLPQESAEGGNFTFDVGKIKSIESPTGYDSDIDQSVFFNGKNGKWHMIYYEIGSGSIKNWDQSTIEKMDNIVRSFKFTK